MTPPQTIADLRTLMNSLPAGDAAARTAAAARQDQLVKPAGSLGRLEEVAIHLAHWQGAEKPALDKVTITIFAGSHGMTKHGVSAFPDEVNAQMFGGFQAGMAAICQLADAFGAPLAAIDCGIDHPTADFTEAPAMTEPEFLAAIAQGFDAISGDEDLVIFGEMGIGNTTAAAAVSAAMLGGEAADWVGAGTGVDAQGLKRKVDVVARGLARHAPRVAEPVEALRRLGGREMAAIFGACLAARLKSVPVLLDGFIVTASVAALGLAAEDGLAHCIAGHASEEPGHRRLLDRLHLDPLLRLNMRLGEGSGAATALGVVKAAVACHSGMATFAEAAVAGKNA
ncbi:nicotinate-nucleotide--dimethylbenzimidazole phosphoribosyltransferase [Minwuia sp.]|uniref:nicotinate-nucleotide--dimethylbenzimidazole phosphoribosyltransferase n=1 Tax=Minwuia sp. TaxID=2493630 RepID=UPI003A8E0C50